VWTYPGIDANLFNDLANRYKGVVLAGTGLGHLPSYHVEKLKSMVDSGIPVVMTSQCLNGRVNMKVYSTGRKLLKAGIISGEDMLPETAYVKLMWVMGHEKKMEKIRELMQNDLRGEINARTPIEDFEKEIW
jgi:glutamyl-tRNA(Gln) amidotransferase subunit D